MRYRVVFIALAMLIAQSSGPGPPTHPATTRGGRKAQLVTGARTGESAIFTQRDQYLYEIHNQHANAPAGPGKIPAELDALRDSWRWVDIEDPVKHPEMRGDMIPVLGQI